MTKKEMQEYREQTFLLLFLKNFYDGEELQEQMELCLREYEAFPEETKEVLKSRAELIYERIPEIDGQIDRASKQWKPKGTDPEEIRREQEKARTPREAEQIKARMKQKAARNWNIGRMAKVDLTVIRLAMYEICYDDAIPVRVAINEAVELAKKFGGEKSPAFVNGVLGELVREMSPEEV